MFESRLLASVSNRISIDRATNQLTRRNAAGRRNSRRELPSVDYTAASWRRSDLAAVDATAASLQWAKLLSVCRTNGTYFSASRCPEVT
jgi:uncharacterized protein YjbI with pentapeptide repeats